MPTLPPHLQEAVTALRVAIQKANHALAMIGADGTALPASALVAGVVAPPRPPDAPPRPASPPPARTPPARHQAPPVPVSGGPDSGPHIGQVVQFRAGWKVEHKDGPVTITDAKITFDLRDRPKVGGKGKERGYFDCKPDAAYWLQTRAAKYGAWTWQQLYDEAQQRTAACEEVNKFSCGLASLAEDSWWSVYVPKQGPRAGQRVLNKTIEQGIALLYLATQPKPAAEPGEDRWPDE